MLPIKTVIFDLNGVFLQSEQLSQRIEDKYGISKDRFWKVLKGVMDEVRVPERNSNPWQPVLDLVGIPKEELFDFWFSGEHLVPELLDYSHQLKERGIKVFILSNNFQERTQYYRNQFPQLFNGLDKTYFSWETGFVKPDKQAWINLLQENNLEPQECVYFDDSEKNIETAQSLGIYAQTYEGLEPTKRYIESMGGSHIEKLK
jgi:HAD superfamily hydrolase (TIGR01509 family)